MVGRTFVDNFSYEMSVISVVERQSVHLELVWFCIIIYNINKVYVLHYISFIQITCNLYFRYRLVMKRINKKYLKKCKST